MKKSDENDLERFRNKLNAAEAMSTQSAAPPSAQQFHMPFLIEFNRVAFRTPRAHVTTFNQIKASTTIFNFVGRRINSSLLQIHRDTNRSGTKQLRSSISWQLFCWKFIQLHIIKTQHFVYQLNRFQKRKKIYINYKLCAHANRRDRLNGMAVGSGSGQRASVS